MRRVRYLVGMLRSCSFTADLLSEPYIVRCLRPVSVQLINLPEANRSPANPWERDTGAIDARIRCKESRGRDEGAEGEGENPTASCNLSWVALRGTKAGFHISTSAAISSFQADSHCTAP